MVDFAQIINAYLPQVILCGGIVLLLLLNLLGLNRSLFYLTIFTVIIHRFGLDHSDLLNLCISVAAVITVAISGRDQKVEFYLLILGVLIGAELLMSSKNFIVMILAIELISISSYVLTAGLKSDKHSAEAAWKFFIYGSVATAVMIFGMTYLYGATGSITVSRSFGDTPMASIGMLMMAAGLLFKMTAVPFHLWAPDVYEATPAPIVAFLSVAPKLAALNMLIRVAPANIQYFAIVTIIIGTLAALNQVNAKRMMAYSSIAQAGFFLAALSAQPQVITYYAIVFTAMNYVVFIVIDKFENASFTSFSGLGYSHPLPAVALTFGLISLTGLPPAAGFMGKLFIFIHVLHDYETTQDISYLVLFIVGLLATVASLFFYLKIPFYMFFRQPEVKQPLKISLFTNLLLVILVVLLLVLFIAPGLVDGML